MAQRERAVRELWEVQKRQLQRTERLFSNNIAENDIGEPDDPTVIQTVPPGKPASQPMVQDHHPDVVRA